VHQKEPVGPEPGGPEGLEALEPEAQEELEEPEEAGLDRAVRVEEEAVVLI
jgi:hypothetical protein